MPTASWNNEHRERCRATHPNYPNLRCIKKVLPLWESCAIDSHIGRISKTDGSTELVEWGAAVENAVRLGFPPDNRIIPIRSGPPDFDSLVDAVEFDLRPSRQIVPIEADEWPTVINETPAMPRSIWMATPLWSIERDPSQSSDNQPADEPADSGDQRGEDATDRAG